MDLKPGTVVWSSMNGKSFWPAIIVNPNDCYWKSPNEGKNLVYWFGDHRVSEVFTSRIYSFQQKFSMFYQKGVKNFPKSWQKGVHEAIQAYANNIGYIKDDWNTLAAIRWAQNGFKYKETPQSYTPCLPASVSNKLKIIGKNIKEANDDDSKTLNVKQKELQLKLRSRKITIEELCIGCYQQNVNNNHPLFRGKVCNLCLDSLRSTMYCFGDDGINYFCAICTRRGEVIICDNINCGRVFCKECIDVLCTKDAIKHIMEQDPWFCFMCDVYQVHVNGLLVRRENWQEEISKLFSVQRTFPFKKIKQPKFKKALRILSLFDGIGTGLFVLDKLNIQVEKYYSCEIDKDAINIVRMHFGDRIEYLGDVKDLTSDILQDLVPIDLLIGGSPCNDLSLVNPAKKGLFGTGILFFEFYRILKLLEVSNNRPMFWLFENVAAMPMETKITINRFFECEPIVLDAHWFSAQHRPRFFWGNLPSLYSENNFCDNSEFKLNNILTKNCNRIAIVDKIRTVTTNPNSLRQGSAKLQPVTMDGEEDTVWITELEEVFGFPRHYTDLGNLSVTRRQQLLGKAWSVPVIQYIFQCLKSFFKCKNSAEN